VEGRQLIGFDPALFYLHRFANAAIRFSLELGFVGSVPANAAGFHHQYSRTG
jgi:hypothetical protein